ncbi:MAG: hypothetical protein ACLR5H_05485 [Oscillospiraceae bacterium]
MQRFTTIKQTQQKFSPFRRVDFSQNETKPPKIVIYLQKSPPQMGRNGETEKCNAFYILENPFCYYFLTTADGPLSPQQKESWYGKGKI